MPRKAMMVPYLPIEMWERIVSMVSSLSDLVGCLGTSKDLARLVIQAVEHREGLNRKQAIAFAQSALLGKSLFLTGGAGVGKTYVVKKITEHIVHEHGSRAVAVTASTGAAAKHVNGMTIHRFAGLTSRSATPSEVYDENGLPLDSQQVVDDDMVVRLTPAKIEHIRRTRVLVLDEVSMVSAETFNLIERALRKATGRAMPFGGLQVVIVGDFCQLPPVIGKKQARRTSEVYAFEAQSWDALDPRVVELTEIKRQDPTQTEFKDLLKRWRMGEARRDDFEVLKKRSRSDHDESPLAFFATNDEVTDRNDIMLEAAPGHTSELLATDVGDDSLKRGISAPLVLKLKPGCTVMAQCNQSFPDGRLAYANGSIGKVRRIGSNYLLVKWDHGRSCKVYRREYMHRKKVGPGKHKVFRRLQYPVQLCFALTHHKSQGMTVHGRVDMRLFGPSTAGRLYTVLSRAVSLENVRFVRSANYPKCIGHVDGVVCDARVKAFYARAEDSMPQYLL